MAKSNWKSVLCRSGQQDRRYNVSGKEILEIHPREASKKKKDWMDIKKIKIKRRFPHPSGYFSISRACNNHRFCRKRVFYDYTAPKRSSALSLHWEPLQSAVVSILLFYFFCIFHSVIYDHITCTYLEYFFSPHCQRHAVDCLRVCVYLSTYVYAAVRLYAIFDLGLRRICKFMRRLGGSSELLSGRIYARRSRLIPPTLLTC